MKLKVIWLVIGVVAMMGLLAGGFGCAQPAGVTTTVTAPAKTVTTTVTAAAEKPEVIKWTMQAQMSNVAPYGHWGGPPFASMLHGVKDRGYVEWVKEATGGRLDIEVVDPGAIFPSGEALTNIGEGVIESVQITQGWFTGTLPEAYVACGMPMAWPDQTVAFDCYYYFGLKDIMDEAYSEWNVKFYPIADNEVSGIIANFPIPNPEAIKGRKLRIWGSVGKWVEALGGSPIAMAYADVYMGLKLGTIEGSTTSAMALEDAKLKEVATDMLISPRLWTAVDCILINQDAFNELPEDIQKIIDLDTKLYQAAAQYAAGLHQQYAVATAKKEYGLQTWEWSTEDAQRVRQLSADEVWSFYADMNPRNKQMVEMIVEHLKILGYL